MSAGAALRDFLRGEAAGGVVLMAAAGLAMVVANSPLAEAYFHALHAQAGPLSVHAWINDAAMALFFLLVGLEIRREFVGGELARWDQRRLPVLAAVAGMAGPALVFLFVTHGTPGLANGWAIPAATDIAFAIGVLAILGSRAPASLKLFLTTVAIVDDLGAVAIIALFYTAGLDLVSLGLAGVVLAAMIGLNRAGVKRLPVYLALAAVLWVFVFRSGVHATVAGVLAALVVPMAKVETLEHGLHPWSAFLIVPLFGFANAGVSLSGVSLASLLAPLPLGIAAGLFLGKQVGIFASIWVADRTGFAARPAASWLQIWGVALLAGIGFTMSLFIGGLAYPGRPELADPVKIGVLAGSLLSALAGYAVLRLSSSTARPQMPSPPSASAAPTGPVDVQP